MNRKLLVYDSKDKDRFSPSSGQFINANIVIDLGRSDIENGLVFISKHRYDYPGMYRLVRVEENE